MISIAKVGEKNKPHLIVAFAIFWFSFTEYPNKVTLLKIQALIESHYIRGSLQKPHIGWRDEKKSFKKSVKECLGSEKNEGRVHR
jgi:hypothetical protein